MSLAKWSYYGRSVPLMIGGIRNWTSIVPALLTKQGRVVRLKNLQLFYRDAMDVWTIKETCLDDHYRIAGRTIRPRGTVIDIGAGLGDFSIAVASAYPGTRVLAFEPFPESAALCRRNVRLNHADTVSVLEHAVGERGGTVKLDISARESVQHSTARESVQHSTASGAKEGKALSVATQPLAEVFAEHAIEWCDLLKLDCEGAEFEILLSLDPAIFARIGAISLEYHDGVTGHSHQDLVAVLEQAGFKVDRIANPVHNHLGFLHATRD